MRMGNEELWRGRKGIGKARCGTPQSAPAAQTAPLAGEPFKTTGAWEASPVRGGVAAGDGGVWNLAV